MTNTSPKINPYPHGMPPIAPEPKSGRTQIQRFGNQPASAVTLPQSNGVNITIINPTTTVGGTVGSGGATGNSATLIPSKPDSFTASNSGMVNPAEAVPNNAPVSMVQPGVNVSSSDGSMPPQTLSPTPTANTPATPLNGQPTPSNPQEHLMQEYKNLDNQYQNLQKAEQDYADAQKRYQDLGNNVNSLAYQQNTGTPASGLPNATADNTSASAGGNPFIFPIRQGSDGMMHIENPPNSGFPPGYSPYATYNALTPLPNSGTVNSAMPFGVFTNPADPPKPNALSYAYTPNNTPVAGMPIPDTSKGTFASVAPPAPPMLPPIVAGTPPAQQVIITPTMTVPAQDNSVPFSQQQQPTNATMMGDGQSQQVTNPEEAVASTPSPSQQLALPASQQQPLELPIAYPQGNVAEQQVLDSQLNSVLGNPSSAYQAFQPNYDESASTSSTFLQPTAQPQQGDDFNAFNTVNNSVGNTSTNSALGGFVPSTANVPLPAYAPAEGSVGAYPENAGAFNLQGMDDSNPSMNGGLPFVNNNALPQEDSSFSQYNNTYPNDGGSTNTMGLQMPPAYNQFPQPQGQRPAGPQMPPAPQPQVGRPQQQPQQQSFNATQVTPQDVAFFQEVLKMNPETAQVAGALPPAQIAQLLSGDKELLGTVRQIEGMLPPGTPPSALAAMMPPPPQGGPAPNRPMMPPPQQPQMGIPQQQAPQRPMMPPQQPAYGYAPQGR